MNDAVNPSALRPSLQPWRAIIPALIFLTPSLAEAGEEEPAILVHLYCSEGCLHCAKACEYMDTIEKRNEDIYLRRHSLTTDQKSWRLFERTVDAFGIAAPDVPLDVIGHQVS